MTPTTLAPVAGAHADVDALLRRLYRTMVTVRTLERSGLDRFRGSIQARQATSRGLEAAHAASLIALDPLRDAVFASAPSFGAVIASGADPGLEPLVRRRASNTFDGAITHATAWALGAKLDRTRGCALAWLGDGAAAPLDVRTTMRTAVQSRLPVVFFSCGQRSAGTGMPVELVDGADALAIHEAMEYALGRVRAGAGPILVDAVPPSGESWPARDPLLLCEQRLRRTGSAGDDFFSEIEDTADAVAARMRMRLLRED